ncbi:hypothetical protein M404DRAFT_32400 [Pisolithus tinctorius Marx 270]|uniref:Uncharacterized protein n=1 Tax=Pisolithus tinctorius Marx 270 TaxID=870435 RepID=A0A0C3IK18_PISTI|nr:hypothetical protein M404DRAFT_32400 [Pisolithus tinctorius Marx 270]
MIRGTTTIYEERQRTVNEKLGDMIQRYYYEWGEWSGRAEGLNLATATVTTMTTTATTVTATTTTTRLEADWWPCKAGTAVHWERGAMSAGTADSCDEVQPASLRSRLKNLCSNVIGDRRGYDIRRTWKWSPTTQVFIFVS